MDGLKQWALCLILSAAAATFVMILSPRGSLDKTLRAVAGIFVVAAMCAPLVQVSGLSVDYSEFEYADETVSADELEAQIVDACRKALETQIADVASRAGAEVLSVKSELSLDENGCIIIHDITIKIADLSVKPRFEQMLEEEIGAGITVN